MWKVLLPSLGFCAMAIGVNGQQTLNHDPRNVVDPTGFMRVLAPPVEVEGSAYMFEDWQTGDIYLSQGRFAAEAIFNYDVMNHILTVLVDHKEYSLNPVAVDSIQIRGSSQILVNPMVFETINIDLLLLELYSSSHSNLYRRTLAEVIKPTYNELFNVGNRNFQIDQDYYYLLHDKGEDQFFDMNKKKEIKNLDNGSDILKYIKDQNLDLKYEPHLIEIVKYYEQLKY